MLAQSLSLVERVIKRNCASYRDSIWQNNGLPYECTQNEILRGDLVGSTLTKAKLLKGPASIKKAVKKFAFDKMDCKPA